MSDWTCARTISFTLTFTKNDLTLVQLYPVIIYHICGLFGGDFNLAVWRIIISLANYYWFAKFKLRRLNSHTQNELIYLLFRQIKMTPTLFFKQIAKYSTRQ